MNQSAIGAYAAPHVSDLLGQTKARRLALAQTAASKNAVAPEKFVNND
jgi:hypothetical protein